MGQSMAALFSPEGEKLRAAQKEKAEGSSPANGTFKVPGTKSLSEAGKSQDSLGNPMSPGYEPLNLKKKPGEAEAKADDKSAPKSTKGFEPPSLGPQFIRLGLGWEKILITQKKVCEKAKSLFTLLEGPMKYRGQRKGSLLESKARGAILDLDLEESQAQALAEAEAKKKKTA